VTGLVMVCACWSPARPQPASSATTMAPSSLECGAQMLRRWGPFPNAAPTLVVLQPRRLQVPRRCAIPIHERPEIWAMQLQQSHTGKPGDGTRYQSGGCRIHCEAAAEYQPA